MKIIKIFIILALVAFTLQRTEKKSKTVVSKLTTKNRSKSVANNYAITIHRDSQADANKIASCNFRVDKINTSDSEGHIGLPFDGCSGMDATKFTAVFYKTTTNYYILEYKKSSSSVGAYNPSGDSMYFYFNVNVSGTQYTYYFKFEYHTWWSIIDFDTDLNNTLKNKIIGAINAQKNSRQQ